MIIIYNLKLNLIFIVKFSILISYIKITNKFKSSFYKSISHYIIKLKFIYINFRNIS